MTKNTKEMSFLSHLEILRWHLLRSLASILVVTVIAFLNKRFIFDTLIFGPKNPKFITYRFLCKLSKMIGMSDSLCIDKMPFIIQNRTMAGQFSAHIWTAIITGVIVSFPYIVWELWRFIKPGLLENEQKYTRRFVLVTSCLFFTGVLFGYYVITPLSVNFLANYQVSSQIVNEIDLGSYIGLVNTSVLSAGLVFELPMVIFFLTKAGLVTPSLLRKYRKYALVGVLTLSAIITPPDISSQVLVAIPIVVLYEVSIKISAMIVRKEKEAAG